LLGSDQFFAIRYNINQDVQDVSGILGFDFLYGRENLGGGGEVWIFFLKNPSKLKKNPKNWRPLLKYAPEGGITQD